MTTRGFYAIRRRFLNSQDSCLGEVLFRLYDPDPGGIARDAAIDENDEIVESADGSAFEGCVGNIQHDFISAFQRGGFMITHSYFRFTIANCRLE